MPSLALSEGLHYTPGALEKSTTSGLLNAQQRAFYEKNGFIIIPKLIPEQLLDECQQRFLDIVDGRVEKGIKQFCCRNTQPPCNNLLGGITMMKDISLRGKAGISQERIVNKIQDLVWDEVFAKYLSE